MDDEHPGPDATGSPLRDPDAAKLSRAELRLRNRALRERWAVPPDLIDETLYAAQEILASLTSSDRDKIAAARLLLTMARLDQADDKLDLERSKLARPDQADARDAWQDLHDETQGGHP